MPAAQPLVVHVRGTLVSADSRTLVVKDRSGQTVTLQRPDRLSITEVYPIDLQEIRQGSFIGTTGMPQPDGTQQALEVHIFPPSMKGTGEGHYPWDLQSGSTMTNASVTSLEPAPGSVAGGRTLRLRYAGGEQTVVVPVGVPVVELGPGDETMLVPDAQVIVAAQMVDSKPTALNLQVGRDGFKPPY